MSKDNIDLGGFDLDLARLIETKLLIQANSGGGKSWCIRKILEATHGKVQHIVLDMEGEFSTLREKFDYVLAGKGGDVAVDTRSAELLARKLLELGASAIIDLYELKHHDRIRFVKLFLDAMINAPKELWHEVLVVIDEVHVFAPEKGKAESLGSVIDLASRGRKRGFSAILATQRLSKLHKDVAAECGNKLIGRTGLDIDMKRAAEELGFSSKQSMIALRNLDPGQFFCFGPALSKSVAKVQIGPVKTKHPKAGQRMGLHAPAPTEKVKELLSKLSDLPKEAEEELRDRSVMKEKIRHLERELKSASSASTMSDSEKKALYEKAVKSAKKEIAKNILKLNYTLSEAIGPVVADAIAKCNDADVIPVFKDSPYSPRLDTLAPAYPVSTEDKTFGKCERMILKFLAMRLGRTFTNIQIGALTGYASGSGGFNNALSKLSKAGLIMRDRGGIYMHVDAVDEVRRLLGSDFSESGQHALEDWLNKLDKCAKTIYQVILKDPSRTWTKDRLGEDTGYAPGSGGFNNAISKLSTLGLIKRSGGSIQINDEIVGI